jgi:hypothetical protein
VRDVGRYKEFGMVQWDWGVPPLPHELYLAEVNGRMFQRMTNARHVTSR